MKVIDLVGEYVSHGLYQHDYSSYERVYPALFKHYFTYWAYREPGSFSANVSRLLVQRETLLAELPVIEAAFHEAGFDLSDTLIVLFAGVGTTNGHAMKERGKFLVWLPVETYPSAFAVRIFMTHEIIHALHYTASPGYYFDSPDEQRHLGRMLVTEGIATYLTQRILDTEPLEALWADYLLPGQADHWLRKCHAQEHELVELCKAHFGQSEHRHLFQANDPSDVLHYRAGYYVGLKVIESVVATHCLDYKQLLSLKRKHLDDFVLQALRQMQTES